MVLALVGLVLVLAFKRVHLCTFGRALDSVAAFFRTLLGFVRLADGDDLAVAGFQTEPVLARLVLVYLELA